MQIVTQDNENQKLVEQLDYSLLDADDAEYLQERAEIVHEYLQQTVECIVQTGFVFREVRDRVGGRGSDGLYAEWLKQEFDLTTQTARNYINVAERFGGANTKRVLHLAARVIYALAMPSTSDEIIDRVLTGEIEPTVPAIQQAKRDGTRKLSLFSGDDEDEVENEPPLGDTVDSTATPVDRHEPERVSRGDGKPRTISAKDEWDSKRNALAQGEMTPAIYKDLTPQDKVLAQANAKPVIKRGPYGLSVVVEKPEINRNEHTGCEFLIEYLEDYTRATCEVGRISKEACETICQVLQNEKRGA